MTFRAARLLLGCVLALAVLPALAQLGLPRPAASAPSEQRLQDPFGRDTPRGSVAGFVNAAHRGNIVLAARYLQLPGGQRARAEELVQDLGDLMDRYFLLPLNTVSDEEEGRLDDALPLDREHVGPLRMAGEEHFIELVRVDDPSSGRVWLVSAQTLARVPQLHAAMDRTWAERALPRFLSRYTLFGFPLSQLVLWAASLLLPFLLLWLVSRVVFALVQRLIANPQRREFLAAWHAGTRWPMLAVLTLLVHAAAIPAFGSSLAFRLTYGRVLLVLLVVAFAWLLLRAAVLAFQRADMRLLREGRSGTRSVMLLGERLFKLLLLLVAVMAVLAVIGVDITTALAGLGIVGIAVALGAQKTVENILGGILLLGDEAIAVGDFCTVAGSTGTIEDITLRSVRIRTQEQTLLSIPAGVLAQASIENFSTRGKCLARNNLRLAYGTTSAQLRTILEKLRALLAQHERIEQDGARVRLVAVGPRGIELELFAYFLTADWPEFLALREELLLQATAIVEEAGVAFAPLYLLPESAAPAP